MVKLGDYIKDVETIVDVLDIGKEPVGVKYTDREPRVKIEAGNYTVCGAILKASEGKVILLSEDRCACSRGKRHIGLTQGCEIPWKMLVEGEKLWCDVKTAIRSSVAVEKIARPPFGLSQRVFFYPVREGIFQLSRSHADKRRAGITAHHLKSVLGWGNALYRNEGIALLEHDNLSPCIRELQPLGR